MSRLFPPFNGSNFLVWRQIPSLVNRINSLWSIESSQIRRDANLWNRSSRIECCGRAIVLQHYHRVVGFSSICAINEMNANDMQAKHKQKSYRAVGTHGNYNRQPTVHTSVLLFHYEHIVKTHYTWSVCKVTWVTCYEQLEFPSIYIQYDSILELTWRHSAELCCCFEMKGNYLRWMRIVFPATRP